MGAERWISLDSVILSQEFPYLGVRVIQVAKDHGLAIATGFDTGGEFANTDALGAKITFFDDTAGTPREIGIQHLDELFRVAPVEAPAAIRAGRHAEPATDAAMIVHNDDTIFVAESRLGGAGPHTGRAVAMIAEDWHLEIFGFLCLIKIRAFRKGVLKIGHPDPFDLIFLIRKLGNVMHSVAGRNNLLAQGRILAKFTHIDQHAVTIPANSFRFRSMLRRSRGEGQA